MIINTTNPAEAKIMRPTTIDWDLISLRKKNKKNSIDKLVHVLSKRFK